MTSTKFVLTLAVTGGGLKAAVIVGWYLTKSPALYWMAGAWDPVVTWAAGRLADYWVPTGYGGDLLLVAGTAVESAGIGMFLAALQRGYLRFRGPLQR